MLATPAIHIGHGVIEFPPAIVAGVAYVAQDSGFVTAVNTADGTQIWQVRIAHAADSPVVAHMRVFVDTSIGLVALSAKDGHLLWRRAVGAGESTPTVFNNRVCVGAKAGGVFCFGQYGGGLLRHIPDRCKITGHVAAYGGSLYWNDYCGFVTRAGPHRVVWSVHAGRVFYAAPVVFQGTVYVADRDSGTYDALSAASGQLRWRTHVGSSVYGTPAVTQGAVYGTWRGAGQATGGFVKLARGNGSVLWSYPEDVHVIASPVVTGTRVWFATAPDHFAAGQILAFNVNGMGLDFTFGTDGRYTPIVAVGTDAWLVGRQDLYGYPGEAI